MKTILSLTTLILLTATLPLLAGDSGAKWDDYTPKQIKTEVRQQLGAYPKMVALRVKGLVCESCGLGLRKKISKLPQVDKKQFKKGVKMDVYRMLLYVAFKDEAPQKESLSKAIESAGYDLVEYHVLDGQRLLTSKL